MAKYHSRNTLVNLPAEKFANAWEDLMAGRYLYRTWDKRVLNFKLGTETQGMRPRTEEEYGAYAIYKRRHAEGMVEKFRHTNRKDKKRSGFGRRG